ncbi:FecR domain-containing protein [Ottowia sp.]|uniref:FecR domain-containing protein n=1 Tax=Ottowia sp. TaxID=1898956 RepID=UPI0039E42183
MTAADTSPVPTSGPLPEPSHQAMEQAAEWFALLRSGEATDAERGQWQAWLDSSDEHRQAWGCVERVSHRFAPIKQSPDRHTAATAYREANGKLLRRRQGLLGIAALAGTGLLGWAAWRHTPLPGMALAWMADHHTGTGEVREVALADGTRVWLNAASAFNVDYRADLRRLNLLAGEILIQTAADAGGRPFAVDTPQGRLRALGTRFTVRMDEGHSLVAVQEGAVEVRTAGSGTTAVIQAGRQTRFTGESLGAIEDAETAREAWTRGILFADDIPLSDVVRELRRYRSGHLGLAPEVADLRVFGNYPVNDPDRALAMLESVMPIRVRRTLPWWVSIEPHD